MTEQRRLREQGLYHPRHEHDACGVGFVASIKGIKSHDIIQKGLRVLQNLTHRGACGCDPLTGDGAGVLMQVPHEFFRKECALLRIDLPEPRTYGVGMVFLPRDVAERNVCKQLFEKAIREEGQHLLGWRSVPVNGDACGPLARKLMPEIRQVFVGSGRGVEDQEALERKLYVIRKSVESGVRQAGLRDSESFYIASLSARRVVYKGLLLPDQIMQFYSDLCDP